MTGYGKNPLYGICARFTQCTFLVAQVEICQSPDFDIYILNNPSNYCRILRRLVVLYEGEISLHFDQPSQHSHRTRSPLLWALIIIFYLDTGRFIELLYVRSSFNPFAGSVNYCVCTTWARVTRTRDPMALKGLYVDKTLLLWFETRSGQRKVVMVSFIYKFRLELLFICNLLDRFQRQGSIAS